MLCAGLTVFSPLVRNGAGPGKTVGVVGIGGLVSIYIFWKLDNGVKFSLSKRDITQYYSQRLLAQMCMHSHIMNRKRRTSRRWVHLAS